VDVADQTWDEFRRTFVRIDTGEGQVLEVHPAGPGERGEYLPGEAGPLHIVTACNPQGRQQSEEANFEANRRLLCELAVNDDVLAWPTTGHGTDDAGAETDWSEPGVTVAGLSRDEALALGRRYDQAAIFEWLDEPGGFRLLSCDGSVDEPRGWVARWAEPSSG
jgi:hypothetical protein